TAQARCEFEGPPADAGTTGGRGRSTAIRSRSTSRRIGSWHRFRVRPAGDVGGAGDFSEAVRPCPTTTCVFAFRRQAGAGIIAVLPPARRGRDATAGGLSTTLPRTSTRPHVSAPNLHVRGLAIVTAGVFILSFDALLVRLAGATPADFGFWRGMFICMSLLTL